MSTGTVIHTGPLHYLVQPAGGGAPVPCVLKGNLRLRGVRTTNPVAIGDRVTFLPPENSSTPGRITDIMPRSNYIIRRASNLSKESHILAANLDQAILVAGVRDPLTATTFIDRFMATASAYGVPAALLLNKRDTWDEDDRELADAVVHLYTSIGYPATEVSARTGEGLDTLRSWLKDKTTLLAGNSGVGKTSLINALIPDLDLRTSSTSVQHRTGTHTTTESAMYPLPEGGYIIDIPGVKSFGTIDLDPASASHYFPEIFETGHDCRFQNCTHTHEPGCAVLDALKEQRIAQSRYQSYLSILEDTNPDKYRKPY